MTVEDPIFLWLIALLPILAWLKGRHDQQPAFLYSSTQLVRPLIGLTQSSSGWFQKNLRWLTLALLLVALSRPQVETSEKKITSSGIDIVIALDLSMSMLAEDLTVKGSRVNRVIAAKEVMKEFIKTRPSDRIGVVAFAGLAYIAAPLTLDHDFVLSNLERLEIGLIEDGTAIGHAILTSVIKIMILLFDLISLSLLTEVRIACPMAVPSSINPISRRSRFDRTKS
jgi:Ca-activated chloride channel homolog